MDNINVDVPSFISYPRRLFAKRTGLANIVADHWDILSIFRYSYWNILNKAGILW
jgi:hypothetical protein